MAERIHRYKESSLHYEIIGTGSNILLLFHGFGQDHHVFRSFSETLSDTYTMYFFDLYFHGESKWGYGEEPLEKNFWKDCMNTFLNDQAIDVFSMAGFSLGGKFVLATLEAFPEKTKSVFLLAPDGIKTSFWYSLATYPLLFRRIFKSMIHHHTRFIAIARMLNALGLMDKGLIRFATRQMDSEEKRSRVYCSWVVFRRLQFNINHIAHLINDHSIHLTLITGKYDKVIKPENMKRLIKTLNNYQMKVVETGHNRLIESSLQFINPIEDSPPPKKI